MNPRLTITIDERNRAIAVASGMLTVGAKVDISISGLPDAIPQWVAGDSFVGASLRFRLVDLAGHDLVRYPLAVGDKWDVEGDEYLTTTPAEFDTDALRNAFFGVVFNDYREFGIIIDSALDDAQYATGRVKVRQWAVASTEDPTVLPDWRETLKKLREDLASVSGAKDAAEAARDEAVSAKGAAEAARDEAAASAAYTEAAIPGLTANLEDFKGIVSYKIQSVESKYSANESDIGKVKIDLSNVGIECRKRVPFGSLATRWSLSDTYKVNDVVYVTSGSDYLPTDYIFYRCIKAHAALVVGVGPIQPPDRGYWVKTNLSDILGNAYAKADIDALFEPNKPLANITITTNWSVSKADGTAADIDVQRDAKHIDLEFGYVATTYLEWKWTLADGQKPPTACSGYAGTTLPEQGVETPWESDDLKKSTTFTQTITAPKTGLVVVNGSVVKASGQLDSRSASVSVTFKHRWYFGVSTSATPTADAIRNLAATGLTLTLGLTSTGVKTAKSEYLVYSYPAALGAITKITQDGATPVFGAFTRRPDVTVTNDAGAKIVYAVYVSNNDGAFAGAELKFE